MPRAAVSATVLGWLTEAPAALLRGLFLLSLLVLAGTAKFPTGGIFASPRGPYELCGV